MGRIHRSGKEFHPKITSPDDDAVEANIPSESDVILPQAVPKFIHGLIQDALAIRDDLGWKKEVVDSNNKLKSIEMRIQLLAEEFIPEFLPHGWKYDPFTARNLVPIKSLNRDTSGGRIMKLRPRKKKTCDRCNHKFPRVDKDGIAPKIYETSIKEKMKPSWDEFKKFDFKIPMLDYSDQNDEELKTFIPCELPFVKDISNFALDSFNEALDTRVKYKQGKLTDLEMMECHYYKLEPNYWFYMMIKANEGGKCGVYEVKVEIGFEDGLATLCKFDFLRFDDDEFMEIDEGQDGDVEYDPEDYMYSGLVERRVTKSEVARRGYDYRNQYCFDRILMM